jgi:DNA-binding NarL/FixJ family response regulator
MGMGATIAYVGGKGRFFEILWARASAAPQPIAPRAARILFLQLAPGLESREPIQPPAAVPCVAVLPSAARVKRLLPRLLAAGFVGCLQEDASASEIERAIRDATAGCLALSHAATETLLECFRTPTAAPSLAKPRQRAARQKPAAKPRELARLTKPERKAMTLLARHFTNKEIAARLNISVPLAEKHLRTAYAKLGVHCRTEALARWLDAGRGA